MAGTLTLQQLWQVQANGLRTKIYTLDSVVQQQLRAQRNGTATVADVEQAQLAQLNAVTAFNNFLFQQKNADTTADLIQLRLDNDPSIQGWNRYQLGVMRDGLRDQANQFQQFVVDAKLAPLFTPPVTVNGQTHFWDGSVAWDSSLAGRVGAAFETAKNLFSTVVDSLPLAKSDSILDCTAAINGWLSIGFGQLGFLSSPISSTGNAAGDFLLSQTWSKARGETTKPDAKSLCQWLYRKEDVPAELKALGLSLNDTNVPEGVTIPAGEVPSDFVLVQISAASLAAGLSSAQVRDAVAKGELTLDAGNALLQGLQAALNNELSGLPPEQANVQEIPATFATMLSIPPLAEPPGDNLLTQEKLIAGRIVVLELDPNSFAPIGVLSVDGEIPSDTQAAPLLDGLKKSQSLASELYSQSATDTSVAQKLANLAEPLPQSAEAGGGYTDAELAIIVRNQALKNAWTDALAAGDDTISDIVKVGDTVELVSASGTHYRITQGGFNSNPSWEKVSAIDSSQAEVVKSDGSRIVITGTDAGALAAAGASTEALVTPRGAGDTVNWYASGTAQPVSTLTTSLSSDNRLVTTVTTTQNGRTLQVQYVENTDGQLVANKVLSIDGQPPVDDRAYIAALNQQGITPENLAENVPGANAFVVVGTDNQPVLDATGNPVFVTPADTLNATDPNRSDASQTLVQALTTVGAALTLIKAIQTGNPLPIAVSGLRLASTIDSGNTTLSEGANIGAGILSLVSLENALKRGDTMAAVTAGAQAVNFGAQAYTQMLSAQYGGDAIAAIDAGNGAAYQFASDLGEALPYLSLINDIAHGNAVYAALDVVAIAFPPAAPFIFVAELVFGLFGDDSPSIPDPWGSGRYVWNGTGIAVSAVGETGGDQAVSGFMNNVLASMNTLIAREQQQNPGSALGIIPNRMPELGYGMDGFHFTDIDPLTGVQKNPALRYGTNGNPYNATPGSTESFESLGQAFLLSALARGAIAPEWEVQTAALQTQMGDPQAGLTEEERAGRAGDLAPPESGATQTWRPVVLDLNGAGIQTVSETQSGVAFDVDDSGYLKNTAWIGDNDAFLTLDRNYNGQVDSSRELFSNGAIGLDRRGLAGLAWVDANHDGVLDASDPVFNELRLWQDKNGDGAVEAGEQTTLAQNGISSLNYTMGTFVENGVTRQMAAPDLTADTLGEKVNVVPEGILVQSSAGETSLLVTRVDDLTQVQANEDHVTGIENVELIVGAPDLLANDTFGGVAGRDLTVTGVQNVQHGTAYVDANQFVHFQPEANYSGDGASFDYAEQGPNGQSGTATVLVSLEHVNQAPTASDARTYRQIYGYMPVAMSYDENGNIISTGGDPIYEPFVESNGNLFGSQTVVMMSEVNQNPGAFPTTDYDYHTTPVAQEDTSGGKVVGSDVDDPASSLTYQLVGNPQYGAVTMDAQGDYQYTPWTAPNGQQIDVFQALQYQDYEINPGADAFQVKVSDPHGASTLLTVTVPHPGGYYQPPPPTGGGGKKPIAIDLDQQGFSFTNVSDSNVFFDVNGDGWKHRISWVTPGEGLLAYDPNGKGAVTDVSQIALAAYLPGAQTDLQGLAAFDTNHDGVFDKNDADWGKFGIWRDSNQNGISDAGEFKTLGDMGVASISLTSDNQFSVVNGDTIHGVAKVTMVDGTTRNAADVTLAYSKDVQVHNADGSTSVVTPTSFSPSGQEIDGTDGNDLLLGKTGNVIIKTGEGNDVVFSGDGNDVIQAGNGNDVIYAGNGSDVITAGNGNDVIYTGTATDVVIAGNGNNAIFAQGGNDVIMVGDGNNLISGGAGNDVIRAGRGDNTIYAGNGNTAVFVGDGDNTLIGGAGTNRFQVGAGTNTLIAGSGPATMIGGTGNNTFVINSLVDDVQAQAGGVNTVESSITYVLPDNVQNLTLSGTDNLNGTGNELDNVLIGNAGNNVLIGAAGNDVLDGGASADTLMGGVGDDTYIVDSTGDVVIENLGEGIDTVKASISYALTDNVENLTLTGTDDLNATGNTLDNVLAGNAGDNVLDGGLGADTLIGGAGNDTYVVDNTGDVVVENPGAGIDTVDASISYTLTDNVEQLVLTGTTDLSGTGNTLDNLLIGNSGNNVLDGGAGADTLLGGAGNDTYIVDNVGDVVIEKTGEGIDTMLASVSYALSDNVENLTLTGTADLNATGNTLDNVLTGNAGNNVLDGGVGADTVIGGAGNDTYIVDNAGDLVIEQAGEGTDSVLASVSYALSDNVENLTLTGTADLNATGNTLDNVLTGNAGNNVLDGGLGADTLIGGAGNDTYIVDNAGDLVIEQAGEGTDSVLASVSYALSDNVENLTLTGTADLNATGNALNNILVGNAGRNVLDGGAGADTMIGGAGNDIYVVDNIGDTVVEQANEGTDTVLSSVSYVLTDNVENLILAGTANLNGTGNALNNVLTGNAGDNVLDGGTGADTMIGGAGNDTYVVDNVGDVVVENANEGTDTILTSVSYALSDNVENLTLTGTADLHATGNALNNILIGNGGANVLDGGAGADTMIGGAGSDVYVVDNVGDVIVERANEGLDSVLASVSYTLSANVENLTLTGFANIDGTGNALNNILVGNAGNNILDGGAGADTMIGGAGNDTYVVDNVGDVVVENANEGTDIVLSSINYALTNNVENLTLTGSADLNGTGNALNNVLTGNRGNNVLDGGAGTDTMIGGAGNDTYIVDSVADVVVENANEGIDTIYASVSYVTPANVENLALTGSGNINATGNALNNTLIGNSGNNILDGGTGADTMIGGAGNDSYVVDNAGDLVIENAGEGTDTIYASVSYVAPANIENLVLTGSNDINATGNALNNVLIGNAGNNRLDGGVGADSMSGGAGNDTYVVDNVGDLVTENAGEGTDTVLSSINYALTANLENLVLTGTANLNGTGNALNNVLTGNAGNNTLDGGVGADTMIGGAGNDTYIVDNVGDVVVENSGEGVDTVYASVSYALSANVENLIMTGTGDSSAAGNGLNNTLTGNCGNNLLDGGLGADTMIGGAGNDTYIVDNVGDVVVENANEGIDTVLSSVSYTLAANVENLTLTGTASINATGNSLDNVLIGNSGNNVLDGGAGNDILIGSIGNDTLKGGAGNDTLTGGAGNDVLDGGSGNDTYVYGQGDGLDTLIDASGNDTVAFGAGLSVNNLAIRITGGCDGYTAHLRVLDANGCEQPDQGIDFQVSVDWCGGVTSPIESFRFADGSVKTFNDLLIKDQTTLATCATGAVVTGRNDDTIFAGTSNTGIWAGTGNDIVYASYKGSKIYGEGGDDYLQGAQGNDTLDGGWGVDVLSGSYGNDVLSDPGGNSALLGGSGNDQISAGVGSDFIAGGQGTDTIFTGAGNNVVALDGWDGWDTILAGSGGNNTLSLGGTLSYSDLKFRKSGNDLLLDAGGGDGVTLQGWYAAPANRNFVTLQVIEGSSWDYNPWSSNTLYNKKVETFDFGKLVAQFDQARAANPSLTSWNVMNGLLSAHLSGSDTAALGGDLAYQYGMNGDLSGMGVAAAQNTLKGTNFGAQAQTLNQNTFPACGDVRIAA